MREKTQARRFLQRAETIFWATQYAVVAVIVSWNLISGPVALLLKWLAGSGDC
jgi:hypothetical protein